EDRDTHPFHIYNTGRVDINTNITPKGVNSRRSTPITTTSVHELGSEYNEDSDIRFFALALLDDTHSVFEPTRNADGSIKIFSKNDSSYIRKREVNVDPIFDINGNLIIYNKNDINDFSLVGASSAQTQLYEFTYKGVTEDSAFIENFKDKMKYLFVRDIRENNVMNTIQKKLMNELYTSSTGIGIMSESSKWGEYFDRGRLIKSKVDNMKRYEFVNLLSDCLDTDFKAEEASIGEKIFAVVIIIVAIVVTLWTAGAFAPAAMSMTSLALGLGYASLVLTVGGLVLSQMGLSAQGLIKIIGKVAQIVGIAASILGIVAAAQAAFKAAAEAAVKEGTIKTTAEYTLKAFAEDMIDAAVDSVMDSISNVFDVLSGPMDILDKIGSTIDSLTGFMKNLQKGMEMYNKFMSSSGDSNTPPAPTEEQLSKTSFQYPEQMFQLQEQMVYEQDALQKMSAMKENQFGLARTEKLMEQIA
ncbi:hypothetical protein DRO03_09995, partial [Methanosarcinales archaeon]